LRGKVFRVNHPSQRKSKRFREEHFSNIRLRFSTQRKTARREVALKESANNMSRIEGPSMAENRRGYCTPNPKNRLLRNKQAICPNSSDVDFLATLLAGVNVK
jgi:hypothetical protein